MKKNKESFEWVKPIDIPKENLVKIIAKSTSTTKHPEDPKYPKRIFLEEEILKSARSLIARPVGINHRQIIHGAYVIDAEYNEKDKVVEAILALPKHIINKIRKKKIKKCSIEYGWRDEEKTNEGTIFKGLWLQRVDLLEGLEPGDPNTSVQLFESKQGRVLLEMQENKLSEPFAGYTDMDDCIAKNQDKEDPAAFCASIKQKTEEPKEQEPEVPDNKEDCEAQGGIWNEETQVCAIPITEQDEVPTTEEECIAKGGVWDKETQKCTILVVEQEPEVPVTEEPKEEIKEIIEEIIEKVAPEVTPEEVEEISEEVSEEVVEEVIEEPVPVPVESEEDIRNKAAEQVRKIKEGFDKKLKEAKKEAIEEILSDIEKAMPNAFIESKFSIGGRRALDDIKKVVHKYRK